MAWTEVLFLIGRILFGGYFLYNSYNHFRNAKMMAGYAGSKGVPAPLVAVYGSGLLLLLGSLGVLLGVFPHVALALIALFLVGVTPMIHTYWKETDPMARMGEQANFLKNVGLLGATLMMYAIGTPWPYSL